MLSGKSAKALIQKKVLEKVPKEAEKESSKRSRRARVVPQERLRLITHPLRREERSKSSINNQVIVDQYGTFEYDKDPEGYKKARKRQQNRESALRARDKRASKMETVESRLQKIQARSNQMEQENMVLKAEKRQLQDQVKNLLTIITSFGGMKRVKTGEEEEIIKESSSNAISTDSPGEVKNESEFEFEEPEMNDSLSFHENNASPEETMLKLVRNNNDSIFNQEEGGFGDLLQKGLMLSLTIVMCMVMCLTGYSVSEYYFADSSELCTTCSNSRIPFELRPIESRVNMNHQSDEHYLHQNPASDTKLLFHLWIGVFCFMMFLVLLFKKQQYFFYNLLTSPLKRPARA